MATPTPRGTSAANTIQATRTTQDGTPAGSGTNARTRATVFGATIPIRRMGQAAAAPTTAERATFSAPLVCPKRATTAQPKMADRMRPTERLTRARSAWMIAMTLWGARGLPAGRRSGAKDGRGLAVEADGHSLVDLQRP